MFIVELEGDGITSRAVIRKGTVVTRSKVTPIGHELTFYDENGQRIEKLDIWRDSKKIAVEGSYSIPFGQHHGRESIVVCWRGYASR